jgi:CRP/FNR family transcriptional regulator, anaerobic regulatory protein
MSNQNFIDTLLAHLPQMGKAKTFAKGEMLLREGEVEKHLYYVQDGAVRIFLLTALEEQTIRFGYQGSFINSLSSFISGNPSEFYIETLRKTTVWVLPKTAVVALVQSNPQYQQQYSQFLELLITKLVEREIDLLTASPAERLQRVLQRSPNLFQQVPLRYIANYLRMTPETLSRVRNY